MLQWIMMIHECFIFRLQSWINLTFFFIFLKLNDASRLLCNSFIQCFHKYFFSFSYLFSCCFRCLPSSRTGVSKVTIFFFSRIKNMKMRESRDGRKYQKNWKFMFYFTIRCYIYIFFFAEFKLYWRKFQERDSYKLPKPF